MSVLFGANVRRYQHGSHRRGSSGPQKAASARTGSATLAASTYSFNLPVNVTDLAYRYDGKQRTMAFGVYPEVGLADARSKRGAVRKILATGRDPIAVAREEALAEKLAQKVTASTLRRPPFRI